MVNSSGMLEGVIPPIPTPFGPHGEVDHVALRRNLERWNSYGLSGYAVLGSNGETPYLTQNEKLAILETARAAIPASKWMIAGTGCESTGATIELTRRAAETGADAALVISPHFYTNKMTSQALMKHYLSVADASPIPVLLYNVPAFTHLDMGSETVARLAEHPNIVGIKDSGGNITKIADMVRLTPGSFRVLAGSGGFFLPALVVGASGGIMAVANVAPELTLSIYRLFRQGEVDRAAVLQRGLIPLNHAVTARFGVAGLKAALDMLGYHGGPVRPPLMDLDEPDRNALRDILSECLEIS